MPTEHKRKKTIKKHADKDKKSVNIKSEPQDLHPLSYYADDRVELIRQVFSCLKSTAIKSIAPEFLKDKTLDTLREYCLDEIIGISNKRLLSIINATQCPTDTESSDSDIDAIEEHISLEEISSDTDNELSNKKKIKTTKNTTNKKLPENTNFGATGAKKQPPPHKEYSVLELLELQARARAIRSQLALEPVTKIELVSDNESSTSSSSASSSSLSGKRKKTKSNDISVNGTSGRGVITSASLSTKTCTVTSKTMNVKPKPIKLKRNFRHRMSDNDDDNNDDERDKNKENDDEMSVDNKKINDSDEIEKSKEIEIEQKDISNNNKPIERSPSPDIVTIIQSPETYIISSDSENETDKTGKSKKSYINLLNITVNKQLRSETEDEIFLRKLKEANANKINSTNEPVNEIAPMDLINKDVDENVDKEKSNSNLSDANKNQDNKLQEEEEEEEGEIVEDDVVGNISVNSLDVENKQCEVDKQEENVEVENKEEIQEIEEKDKTDHEIVKGNEGNGEVINETVSIVKKNSDDNRLAIDSSLVQCENKIERANNDEITDGTDATVKQSSSSVIEIIDDDDIIDIGKDVDLDYDDFTDDKTIDKKKVNFSKVNDEEQSGLSTDDSSNKNSLKSSENDDNNSESESWSERWLRGKKVTKIMAASRLGNKVRSQLKRKLRSNTKIGIVIDTAKDSNEKPDTITTELLNSEEGSVKQYEILSKIVDDNNKEK